MVIKPLLFLALSASALSAQSVFVTFGGFGDTAYNLAKFGGTDVTASTTFATTGGDVATPTITISDLDIDGTGGNDDSISIQFSISGAVSLLSSGYVLNAGDELTFDITSYSLTLGNGATNYSIDEDGYTLVQTNNGNATTITSSDVGFTSVNTAANTVQSLTEDAGIDGLSQFVITSTQAANGTTSNNRVRTVSAEFRVAIPEPSTAALFAGIAALGFIAMRRRK